MKWLLAFFPSLALSATPNFTSQPDGSVKLSAVEIPGIPGILYACLSSYQSPSKLLCFAVQPDGSVLVVRAIRKDMNT